MTWRVGQRGCGMMERAVRGEEALLDPPCCLDFLEGVFPTYVGCVYMFTCVVYIFMCVGCFCVCFFKAIVCMFISNLCKNSLRTTPAVAK